MRESIGVRCHSGYTYAQDPRWITSGDGVQQVRRVLVRSREPVGPRFVVETEDGIRLSIQYNESEDCWYLVELDVPS